MNSWQVLTRNSKLSDSDLERSIQKRQIDTLSQFIDSFMERLELIGNRTSPICGSDDGAKFNKSSRFIPQNTILSTTICNVDESGNFQKPLKITSL